MTHKEILKKAIHKAITNGWNWPEVPPEDWNELQESEQGQAIDIIWPAKEMIIFKHDFAKALWGEENIEIQIDDSKTSIYGPQPLMGGTAYYPYDESAEMDFVFTAWMYHLQMMVIAEDPIAYLGINL